MKRENTMRSLRLLLIGLSPIVTAFAAEAVSPVPIPGDLMRIVQTVQRRILRLPEYGVFDDIRFAVNGQTIILSGQASRPILKNAVESALKGIEGIARVDNRIEALPFQRFDEDIRFRAYQAIYSHPALSRYNPNRGVPLFTSPAALEAGLSLDPPLGYHPIHIIVRNSRLKLTGVVQNISDKTLAGLIANSLANVFEVENDLAVADEMKPIRHARMQKSRP
jgi:hypothetical protein